MSKTLRRLLEAFTYKAKSGYATPKGRLVYETPTIPLPDVIKYERDPTCKASVDLLADFVYALRNRTDHLSRYKIAKR